MTSAVHHAPREAGGGGRVAAVVRPAHLDSRTAERLFAEILDDAVRTNERGPRAISNAAIGDACDTAESRVRSWRDPHAARPMTAYRFLQLPDAVLRSVLERLLAKRAELRGELGPDDTRAATLLLIGSMARAQGDLARALACPDEHDDAGSDALASPLFAVLRDARRLLTRLGRRAEPGAETPEGDPQP